jgi:hypothetical protein
VTSRRGFLGALSALLAAPKALLAGDKPPRRLPAPPVAQDSQSSKPVPQASVRYVRANLPSPVWRGYHEGVTPSRVYTSSSRRSTKWPA